jgi:branched-chain amino acid transport system permease protein
VVLGGLGSTVGVILAALVLTILPELLRDFAEYRVFIFGVLMVVMMIWKPRGLVRVTRPAFFPSSEAVVSAGLSSKPDQLTMEASR